MDTYSVGLSIVDNPDGLSAAIQEVVQAIHQVFKLHGCSRSDFIVDEAEQIWFMEANTLPSLTWSSLLPKAAAAAGISFGDLCERICQLALVKEQIALWLHETASSSFSWDMCFRSVMQKTSWTYRLRSAKIQRHCLPWNP